MEVVQHTTYAREILKRTLSLFPAFIRKKRHQVCLITCVTIDHINLFISNIYNLRHFRIAIVFPTEFLRNDDGMMCKNIDNTTIKTFDFRNAEILDESVALETCEKYCSQIPTCWGCSLICHGRSAVCDSGDWSAISGCKRPEYSRDINRILISRKPSNTINNIFPSNGPHKKRCPYKEFHDF